MKLQKFKLVVLVLILLSCFVIIAQAEEITKVFPLPGRGNLNLNISSNWKVNTKPTGSNLPDTIEITPAKGNAFQFLITPLWNPNSNTPIEDSKIKSFIQDEGQNMLPNAVEQELVIQRIEGQYAKGYYFMLTDKTIPVDKVPKPDEYRYCIQAGLGVGNLLLTVTLLSNEKSSQDLELALKMLTNAKQTLE